MEELNLDDSPENINLLSNLIEQSEYFVQDSVDSHTPLSVFEMDPMFQRAVFTLATELFYNRTMSAGVPKGLQMMLNHLEGKVTEDGFKPQSSDE